MRPHQARQSFEDKPSQNQSDPASEDRLSHNQARPASEDKSGQTQARPAIEDKTSTGAGSTHGRTGPHRARPAIEDKAPAGRTRTRTRLHDDRGQTTIEFTGTVPLILITLALLWQAAMVGYTFMLAGNAADKAVTAATTARGSTYAACVEAGREDLPSAWDASFDCHAEGDLMTARVDVQVPLFFPGAFNTPLTLPGEASANLERGLGW